MTEFPSIKDKIANMEDVGKNKMFTVPDVKSRMRTSSGAPAAGWMEARTKLQSQLDSLIAKTTAKMTKYGTVHAVEPREVVRDETPEKHSDNDEQQQKKVISPAISSLIKSVASEIQKSFSSKNIAAQAAEADDEDDDKTVCDENNNDEYWRNENEKVEVEKPVFRQPKIDMEAPIDFDYNEPEPPTKEQEVKEESTEEASESSNAKVDESCSNIEDAVDFDSAPRVLESSVAKSRVSLMRKTRARAVSKPMTVMEKIEKELIDASFQVNMSNTEEELEKMGDDEKIDLIAKQISKMESGYIMKLLKQLETGVLDISVPMLLPFLSLQVRLDMGTNIFKNLEQKNKVKVVKENFIQDMINDITDIALLQEVIDRTQEKINFLSRPVKVELPPDYYNIEDDSFDLPLPAPVSKEMPVLTEVLCHLDKLMKEGNNKAAEAKKNNDKPDEKINIVQETTKKCKKIQEEVKQDKPEAAELSVSEAEEKNSSTEEETKSDEEEELVEKKEEAEEKEVVEIKSSPKCEPVESSEENKDAIDAPVEAKKETNESVIKQKLRNILDNCKTNDQQRPGRNFGRNFEYQGIPRPVVPNDRRPAKARKMDDMWMTTLASKQKWPCNNEITVPKPKVPWTMNKNPQPPQKKEECKEVKEYDQCQKTLKSGEDEKKVTVAKKTVKEEVEPKKKEVTSKSSGDVTDSMKSSTEEQKNKISSDVKDEEETTQIKTSENKKETPVQEVIGVEIEKKPKTDSKDLLEVSIGKNANKDDPPKKYVQPKIDMEAPIDFDYTEKSDKKEEPAKEAEKKIEVMQAISKKDEKKGVEYEDAQVKENIPSTPVVRRRGDTFTVILPAQSRPPPPPPASRPPPPPLSPPVPATRVMQLEQENNVVVGKVEEKIVKDDDEEESESEWEWTEESEDEEEEGATYEINKEGWENIMSDAKGPTTFKAEYSIKVGGK